MEDDLVKEDEKEKVLEKVTHESTKEEYLWGEGVLARGEQIGQSGAEREGERNNNRVYCHM